MRANAVKTEGSFRNEEIPGQEFHVISGTPKTTDQRQDPSNILAIRPKAKHEPLLNAREVANKLGVSERWVRDHTTRRSPRIRAVKLGPLVRYRPDDVEMFMDSLDTLRSSRDPQFRV